MEAGRKLDALVAEKVFGYALDYEFADLHGAPTVPALRDQYDEWGVLPSYSTDIGDAWQVVDKLADIYPQIRFEKTSSTAYRWYAKFWQFDNIVVGAAAPTVAHAVCLAALRAAGVEL